MEVKLKPWQKIEVRLHIWLVKTVDFYSGLLSFVYISYQAFMVYVGGGLVGLQGRQFQDVVGSNESILGLL